MAESCPAERALHASLIEQPRREVPEAEIAAVADADARENYRVMLRFRDQLLAAPTLEAFYCEPVSRDIAVPPDFIHHTVQVILRGMLDGTAGRARGARGGALLPPAAGHDQDGAIMLADEETVADARERGGFGSLGRLLREGKMPTRTVELDVLDDKSAGRYFERDERYDTVLHLNHGRPGCAAFCARARALDRAFPRRAHDGEAGARDSRRGLGLARRPRRRGDRHAERDL